MSKHYKKQSKEVENTERPSENMCLVYILPLIDLFYYNSGVYNYKQLIVIDCWDEDGAHDCFIDYRV